MDWLFHMLKVVGVIIVAITAISSLGRSNNLLDWLTSLQNSPAVAQALGVEARILEAANIGIGYDAGIMIRYQLADRLCLGKMVVLPTGKNEFEADVNCPVAPGNSFTAAARAPTGGFAAYHDLAEFGRAVTFAERFQPRLQGRAIREVLAVRRDNSRIVLTYRTTETDEICRLSLKPTALDRPNYAWRLDVVPACDTH